MGFWVSADWKFLSSLGRPYCRCLNSLVKSPVGNQGRIGFDSEQVSGIQQDQSREVLQGGILERNGLNVVVFLAGLVLNGGR